METQISILDLSDKSNSNIRERIRLIEHNAPNHIRSVSLEFVNEDFFEKAGYINGKL